MLRAGFTLLEVLIAIVLLAFIMIGVVQMTDTSFKTHETVISEDKEFLSVENALARLEWDISHMYSPLYYSQRFDPRILNNKEKDDPEKNYNPNRKYTSHPRFAFTNSDGHPVPVYQNTEKNTFEFFTMSNRRKIAGARQSQYAWVLYTLESVDVDEGELEPRADYELVRYFVAENPYNDQQDFGDIPRYVLLQNVKELKFEFWDEETQRWVATLKEVRNGANILRGVKVTLTWIDTFDNEVELMRTYRPLWPYFQPEDLVKLVNTNPKPEKGVNPNANEPEENQDNE